MRTRPGAAGHALRVDLADGSPAVLKLIYPHRESEHEADALALWAGEGPSACSIATMPGAPYCSSAVSRGPPSTRSSRMQPWTS